MGGAARVALVGAGLLLLSTGCARTRITSFVDPDFRDTRYENVLVLAQHRELSQRRSVEEAFVKQLREAGVPARSALEVMPPTRAYTEDELKAMVDREGVDGVLEVTLLDAWEVQYYVPPTVRTYDDRRLLAWRFGPHGYGGRTAWAVGETTTFVSGGYYTTEPQAEHRLVLYDVPSRRTAWLATTLTAGTSTSDVEEIAESMAKAAVKQLLVERIVEYTGSDR